MTTIGSGKPFDPIFQPSISLLDYFIREFKHDTPFVRRFLHGANLLLIQAMLTENLRDRIGLDTMPTVQFSNSILSHLMYFAEKYRESWDTDEVIARANATFVEQFADQNEGRYYETAFWKRWCSQGLPDPNNVPLPLQGDRPDFTAEIDSYMLGNPNGLKVFPRW
jgi:hypothetical protein